MNNGSFPVQISYEGFDIVWFQFGWLRFSLVAKADSTQKWLAVSKARYKMWWIEYLWTFMDNYRVSDIITDICSCKDIGPVYDSWFLEKHVDQAVYICFLSLWN